MLAPREENGTMYPSTLYWTNQGHGSVTRGDHPRAQKYPPSHTSYPPSFLPPQDSFPKMETATPPRKTEQKNREKQKRALARKSRMMILGRHDTLATPDPPLMINYVAIIPQVKQRKTTKKTKTQCTR